MDHKEKNKLCRMRKASVGSLESFWVTGSMYLHHSQGEYWYQDTWSLRDGGEVNSVLKLPGTIPGDCGCFGL